MKPSRFILSVPAHLWLPVGDRTSHSSHWSLHPSSTSCKRAPSPAPLCAHRSPCRVPMWCWLWRGDRLTSSLPIELPFSPSAILKSVRQQQISPLHPTFPQTYKPKPCQVLSALLNWLTLPQALAGHCWLPALSGWECFVGLFKQGRSVWMLLYIGTECNQTHWKWYSFSCLQVIIYFTVREKENSENSSLRGINAYQNQEWFCQNHSWWITTFFFSPLLLIFTWFPVTAFTTFFPYSLLPFRAPGGWPVILCPSGCQLALMCDVELAVWLFTQTCLREKTGQLAPTSQHFSQPCSSFIKAFSFFQTFFVLVMGLL